MISVDSKPKLTHNNVVWIIVVVDCQLQNILSDFFIDHILYEPDDLHYRFVGNEYKIQKLTNKLKIALTKPLENKYIHIMQNKYNIVNHINLIFREAISGKLDVFIAEQRQAIYARGMCGTFP
jgi:hypothetical protein